MYYDFYDALYLLDRLEMARQVLMEFDLKYNCDFVYFFIFKGINVFSIW